MFRQLTHNFIQTTTKHDRWKTKKATIGVQQLAPAAHHFMQAEPKRKEPQGDHKEPQGDHKEQRKYPKTSVSRITVKPLPPIGSQVLVTLKVTKSRSKHKIARLLHDEGPQQLILAGIGLGTVSFWELHQTHKHQSKVMNREEVDIEEIGGIAEPEQLLPQMLIELRWQGDATWYPVRYAPANDGQQGVVLISDGTVWDFNQVTDEWRYPDYPVFVETDLIRVMTTTGARIATVMEAHTNHIYICEWNDRHADEVKNFPLDVYYTQATAVAVEQQVSDASSGGEEEDVDDNMFEVNELVQSNGIEYKVEKVESSEGGHIYVLAKVGGGAGLRITEETLIDNWDPEFKVGSSIVFEDQPGIVDKIVYADRGYSIILDGTDETSIRVTAMELEQLQDLSFDEGDRVFYDFKYYTIVSDRHKYTLKEEGTGTVVIGVTDDELAEWIWLLPANDIYHIVREKELTVKKKKKVYYEVVDRHGIKKDIVAGSKNIKYQEEASNYFVDGDNSDSEGDDGRERIEFQPGQEVVIIKSRGEERGTIIRLLSEPDNDDNEQYLVNINGEEKFVHVGSIDRISDQQPEDEEDVVLSSDSSSSSEDDESEDEDVSEFSVGKYVTINDNTDVYIVVRARNDIYTLRGFDGFEVENVQVENLTLYEPEYDKGDEVLFGGTVTTIDNVNGNGTYDLTNGEENIAENELEDFVPVLNNGTIVSRVGSREVFKIVKFEDGQYTLVNVFEDGLYKQNKKELKKKEKQLKTSPELQAQLLQSVLELKASLPPPEILVDVEEVFEKEEPEYRVGEWVQLPEWQFPCEVISFKKSMYMYKLKGMEREFREAELEPAKYFPEFDKGEQVLYNDEKYTIVSVNRHDGTYDLKNGPDSVAEEDLEAVPDEEGS